MAKYLVLHLGGHGSAGMEEWMAWFEAHKAAVVDMGAPLGPRTTVGGLEEGSGAMGYMIVEADDLVAAKKLVAGSPVATGDAKLEVLEMVPPPDQTV